MPRAAAYIGCSGCQYRHWRGNFYPATVPQNAWLEHYARQFDTVEINKTFYRLPEPATFKDWRRRVPRNFTYAVKASRFLTHLEKLKDPEPPIRRFFARARHLGAALRVAQVVSDRALPARHAWVRITETGDWPVRLHPISWRSRHGQIHRNVYGASTGRLGRMGVGSTPGRPEGVRLFQ